MVHEDTLDAIDRACDWLESDHNFTKNNSFDGDTSRSCIACAKDIYLYDDVHGHKRTPEDQRHAPGCELVAKVAALRAFVRVERETGA